MKISMKYQLKREKIEISVKYPKISIDGYIFLNFVSGFIDIGYMEDILVIYLNMLNLE